ncbi:TetR/AcrR family transcriptional regulator [Mycobacterium talmoniae]|uniref:HTH-type transcriptional regulator AcrR n=1 Tax=Mycobacterium talmoniae TaxID=1858794 RepID=A0A1S1NTU1_9MYCO|nr:MULTISPECIES: TetR/AcrR family transcriptional regulator [Mycobacterium]OHV06650.1 TetR family transcriptional regulator [Mycobacterium talmoniae]PQM47278.1 HTH-type transcriptional regulator AcrR [Mycobacterium talmoniae]TDH50887.1 TetR/AcrR family transcriptional regulator [Mycobacterium eburneum]
MVSKITSAAGKPARVTKRRAETRARLLEAAYRVFADKGFGKVRIDEVCTAAGYTRGAFYSQFDTLDELFFTLYDERAALIAEQVSGAIVATDDGLGVDSAIERAAATLLLDRDWLLVKTDFLMHAARNPDVAQRLMLHRRQLREAIEQRLAGAGVEPPEPFGSVRDVARAVVAAYDGVTVQLLLDNDLAAARTWLSQLLTAVLH